MRTCPKVFDYFGYFMLAIGISFPVQIMLLYGHGPSEIPTVLNKLTAFNWAVIILAGVNFILLRQASVFLKWTLPLTFFVVALNNYLVGQWGEDFSPLMANVGTLGFLAAHTALYDKDVIALLNNPSLRWWLRPTRKRIEVQAFISPYNGVAFKAKTFDISEGGIFIPYKISETFNSSDLKKRTKQDLSVNDKITLCLTLDNLAQIRCDGRIVRQSLGANGRYPAGIGIAFDGMAKENLRELRRYISNAPLAMH